MVPEQVVLVEEAEGIGRITLNRPDHMNAVTVELATELGAALADLGTRTTAIVIRGAGGNFSAGGDLGEVAELRAGAAGGLETLFQVFGDALAGIARIPAVVVAIVEGHALAGGFELMQACDFAVVADDARLGDHHANFSQIPGGGGSQRLPRLIGRQRALGLLLTGEHLTGRQAAQAGLAYRAVPAAELDEQEGRITRRLLRAGPEALAAIKALVYDNLELPLADGLAAERAAVVAHILTPAGGRVYEDFAESKKES
ncbi:MAG: hypothetical protein QOG62_1444 [Thermoleophilaceae bacterium]|nr:hypothetical protein [Thermoleophilaceae bacterium]